MGCQSWDTLQQLMHPTEGPGPAVDTVCFPGAPAKQTEHTQPWQQSAKATSELIGSCCPVVSLLYPQKDYIEADVFENTYTKAGGPEVPYLPFLVGVVVAMLGATVYVISQTA